MQALMEPSSPYIHTYLDIQHLDSAWEADANSNSSTVTYTNTSLFIVKTEINLPYILMSIPYVLDKNITFTSLHQIYHHFKQSQIKYQKTGDKIILKNLNWPSRII